jgi:hypothetical protein
MGDELDWMKSKIIEHELAKRASRSKWHQFRVFRQRQPPPLELKRSRCDKRWREMIFCQDGSMVGRRSWKSRSPCEENDQKNKGHFKNLDLRSRPSEIKWNIMNSMSRT